MLQHKRGHQRQSRGVRGQGPFQGLDGALTCTWPLIFGPHKFCKLNEYIYATCIRQGLAHHLHAPRTSPHVSVAPYWLDRGRE